MYLDDMLYSEACKRGSESRLLMTALSAISDHSSVFGEYSKYLVPVCGHKKNDELGRVSTSAGF